ncbi:MAG: endo alpha-1,4 polygalactosaminidase [Myxococcota bacterium]|nr:endo alpha-1,4 polygalactosaminidase [Myxococcota bacterium]MDW8362602.1 endo alpha-1,4 polygalactosaminidase [Myxococcales bacterium]
MSPRGSDGSARTESPFQPERSTCPVRLASPLVWALPLVLLACDGGAVAHRRGDGSPPSDSSGLEPADDGRITTDASGDEEPPEDFEAGIEPDEDGGSVDPGNPDGDGGPRPAEDGSTDGGGSGRPRLFEPDDDFDYQLGGAYEPPDGVRVVVRDRHAEPAPGLYNICYVNGFQVQHGEEDWWMREHPDLLLRDASGELVIDEGWDELMLAPTSPSRRRRLASIVGGWIRQCAEDGYDAVEIDNLDIYSRSRGLVSEDDVVATMALYAEAAHAVGLAIAQKNGPELIERRGEMGTDFAILESCHRYDECEPFIEAYAGLVLMVEYRRVDFEGSCRVRSHLTVLLRDLNLMPPSSRGYVFDRC